jgi:hypothetical protein
MNPNYREISDFHLYPHDGGSVEASYLGPEIGGGTYVVLNPKWIEAIAESKERMGAAAYYLEGVFQCEFVRFGFDEATGQRTFTTVFF